jgi:protein-S-isoprenylcysteine O-methyltransferase Ste14
MGRRAAAIGSTIFFVAAPGVVAGVVPYFLTDGWEQGHPRLLLQIIGGVMLVAAVPILVAAFVRFVVEGIGTPAPIAPTQELVVGGLYRYVRNPMYLAVGATIVGQGLLLGRGVLFIWAAVFGVAVFAFVRLYEEPTLAETYGIQYTAYRNSVPGWWPRAPGRVASRVAPGPGQETRRRRLRRGSGDR